MPGNIECPRSAFKNPGDTRVIEELEPDMPWVVDRDLRGVDRT
jgi:hypothetical protein